MNYTGCKTVLRSTDILQVYFMFYCSESCVELKLSSKFAINHAIKISDD